MPHRAWRSFLKGATGFAALRFNVLAALVVASALLSGCLGDGSGGTGPGPGEPPVDSLPATLIRPYAGAYLVDSVEQGAHTGGGFLIGQDGDIDFDAGLSFVVSDYADVHDRLGVTDDFGGPRLQIEIKPVPGGAPRRIRLFVDTAAGLLQRVAYYPDSSVAAATVIRVSRSPL